MADLPHPPMTPETSTPSHLPRPLGWGLLAVLRALPAWAGWREYDYRAAAREASAAGYRLKSREPLGLILADWHAALKKETWTDRYRALNLQDSSDLARARSLIRSLRPTDLVADQCPNTDLKSLQGLNTLQGLLIGQSNSLQNVDGINGLAALQELDLQLTALQNVDGLTD